MVHKLWLRITFSFLLLMSFLLLVSGFFLAEMMKNTYFDLKENHLVQTANLVLKAVEIDEKGLSNQHLQNKIMALSSTVNARITVINRDGKVIADSGDNPDKMANHADRPEVQQVL